MYGCVFCVFFLCSVSFLSLSTCVYALAVHYARDCSCTCTRTV